VLCLILRHSMQALNAVTVQRLQSLDQLLEGISEHFSQLCFITHKGTESRNVIFTFKNFMEIVIAEN